MRPLTPEAIPFLRSARAEAAIAAAHGAKDPLAAVGRLRKDGFSADEAAWVVDQARLRSRALGKLPQPARLLLLDEALQQASGLEVAGWRAARLAPFGKVLDLGAGIGGDTLALAAAGLEVIAVERDPVRASLLAANVEALGLTDRVVVRNEDWVGQDWTGAAAAAFVDPARRKDGKRVVSLHAMVPPLVAIQDLADQVPDLLVKVAPALDVAEVPREAGLEFVSAGGELKEALLTFGALRRGAAPIAVVLPGNHQLTGDGERPPRVAPPGAFLIEPDPSVLRAGLVRELGARLDAWQLDPQVAYLSSDAEARTPFARTWRVLRHGKFSRKAVSRWVRERGAGVATVKCRGVALEGEALARKLPRAKGGRRSRCSCRGLRTGPGRSWACRRPSPSRYRGGPATNRARARSPTMASIRSRICSS